ncbi:MAG: TenA family protein [Lentilactobacillus diolivorans]|jgi:thiaminase/transcriptional activator TenA|nr:TenA family protein [Lentilactobacillus diolivorans]RRG04090.1 MAG: thiaminase [Lactobacillus sp.]
MSFSQELITEAQPYLEAVKHSDFVKAILANNLSSEALDYYVGQDLQYGDVETEVQAYLIIYSKHFADQRNFAELLSNHLGIDEAVFKGMTSQNWDTIRTAKMEPVTYIYTHHLLDPIKTGDPLNILASFEAGVWIYVELIEYLDDTGKVTSDNPFHGWLDSLKGDDYQNVSDGFLKVLDRLAVEQSQDHLDKVKQDFLRSCLLEWYFFDASFKQITWDDWSRNALEGSGEELL